MLSPRVDRKRMPSVEAWSLSAAIVFSCCVFFHSGRAQMVETPEPQIDSTFTYVLEFWPELTRSGNSLAFPLPGSFVMPGGFFDWFFYWDSYFILLGLVVQGEWELARDMVENLITEVEQFGYVPNYNAPFAVCKSRSQPPYLTAAIREVYPFVNNTEWLARAYSAAKREYLEY